MFSISDLKKTTDNSWTAQQTNKPIIKELEASVSLSILGENEQDILVTKQEDIKII